MSDFPTLPTLFRIARDEALIRSSSLTSDVVDRPGTDANAMVAVGPVVGDELVGQLIQAQAATFLASAQGTSLDKLVFDRYGIVRKPATPAVGEVQFTTATPTVLGFTIAAGTKITTASGTVFTTTVSVGFPTASVGPIVVAVVSALSGQTQNTRPNTITSMPTAIPGAPSNLAVTNPLATAGAGDAETDGELRARAQQYYATAFRGTLRAIERGAIDTPGVRTATAFEATNEFGDPARWVQVMITDQFAEQFVHATATTPAYDAQAQTLALQVNATLQEFRAAGIYVLVQVAVVTLVGVTLSLRIRPGFNPEIVAQQVKAFTQDYTNALAPGDDFVISDLEAAIAQVTGLEPLGGSVISPTTDLIANPTVAFRTSVSLVTVGECFLGDA
jgi:hypothetical protein